MERPAAPPSSADGPRRIAGGAIVALGGSGVSFLLSTGYQILVARQLGTAGFGVFVLTLAVSTFLAEACDLGLDYGVLRYGAIARGAGDPGRLRGVVRRGLLGAFAAGTTAAVLLAAAAPLVAELFDEPTMVPVLLPLACAIPFTGTSEVARASLRAMGRAVPSVASDSVVTPVVRLASGLVALQIAADPRHVAIGYAVTEVVAFLFTVGVLLRLLPRAGRPVQPKGLFRYSLPMSLNRVLLYTNNQTEIFVLGLLQPAGPVGVFGVARRLSTLLGSLLASIAVLFNPMVADLHHRGQHEELDRLFKTATRWLFTIAFPLCLVEFAFARDLLHLFGPGFGSGAAALAILALGQLVNLGTGTVAGLLAMIGRARLSVLNSLFFLGLSLLLDFLLIPRWDVLGAAIANASALAAVNLLRLVQVRRDLGIVPYDRRFLRPLAAGLAAVAVAWLLPLSALHALPRLGLRVLVLGGLYLALLVLFGIEPDDREVARALRQRLRRRPGPRPPVVSEPARVSEGAERS
ncbi:MAG TPA: polysaccharide biosynthesis C-terminal domain-containing protein [Actinomycetes bacterium]